MHSKTPKTGGNSLLRDNAKNRVAILAQMEKGEAGVRNSNLEESNRAFDLSKSEVSKKSDRNESMLCEDIKKTQDNLSKTELRHGTTEQFSKQGTLNFVEVNDS